MHHCWVVNRAKRCGGTMGCECVESSAAGGSSCVREKKGQLMCQSSNQSKRAIRTPLSSLTSDEPATRQDDIPPQSIPQQHRSNSIAVTDMLHSACPSPSRLTPAPFLPSSHPSPSRREDTYVKVDELVAISVESRVVKVGELLCDLLHFDDGFRWVRYH